MFIVIILLFIILICVISIEVTLKSQLNHSKEIDKSLKQLIYLLKDRSSSQRTEH
ncbi:hypothetical protein [Paenibacillus endoradicis]|uniref:hypothetical protein n=1 Tax=Paenibacillus endoradicis TaxID=2972487 RepID=UPI002159B1A9|nr:hypothetical protein [Paenibacillus endoradicis]MCR8656628.1 hypothetical protein [Paenibacillus endoradicis]